MKTFRVYYRKRNHTFANWHLVSESELASLKRLELKGEIQITSIRQVDWLGRPIHSVWQTS